MPYLRPTNAIPMVYDALDGKKYIMPHGIEVDNTITTDMVREIWNRDRLSPYKVEIPKPDKEFAIPSSSGDKLYMVTCIRERWNCTCPAFGFKKRCKHIEQAKLM